MNRQVLARKACVEALRLRQKAGAKPWMATCVYGLADMLSISVRFVDIGSMEGMYIPGGHPQILITAHRPMGRQAFTCGHELGHHVFGHEKHVDVLQEPFSGADRYNEEEFLADCFAGFLLMPKAAVDRGFRSRGWNPCSCAPEQAYIIAGWLGVGYETLLTHMCLSLRMLPRAAMEDLRRNSPKAIRSSVLGRETGEHLTIADRLWTDRAVDIGVGDFVLMPRGTITEGKHVQHVETMSRGGLLRGISPAITRCYDPDSEWAVFVRVSRNPYIGLARFRHEEEPEDEC